MFIIKIKKTNDGLELKKVPPFESEYHLKACFEETPFYNSLKDDEWYEFYVDIKCYEHREDDTKSPFYIFQLTEREKKFIRNKA